MSAPELAACPLGFMPVHRHLCSAGTCAHCTIDRLTERLQRREERLEIVRVHRIEGDDFVAVEVPPEERDNMPDGIDCRDATIELLEEDITALRAQVETLLEAINVFRDVADESLSSEIPDGHGPVVSDDPEFHRGYDAALTRIRAALSAVSRDDTSDAQK